MLLADYYNNNLPDYYDTMYLDGFTPTEIYIAHRKTMLNNIEEADNDTEIRIVSVVKEK